MPNHKTMLQLPFIRENKDAIINRLAVRNIDAKDAYFGKDFKFN